MTVLAALLAALSVLLSAPPRVGVPGAARPPGRGRRPADHGLPGWPVVVAVTVPAVAALVVVLDGTRLVLVLLLVAATAGGVLLGRRRRSRRHAEAVAAHVQECCELLASELRAGRPPHLALAAAAGVWPDLEPAATAARLGADVPTTLEGLSGQEGRGSLTLVAAAWRIAHRTGSGLAEALDLVVELVRDARQTSRLVESELASARATARMVAVLPVLVLVAGSGLGGDPWHFLLATPVGLCCLGAGLLLAWLGLCWIERIADAVRR